MRGARRFEPRRPWPTAPQASARTIRLIVFVVVSQFYRNGLQAFLPGRLMGYMWFLVGTIAGAATIAIETFMFRERRWGR